MGRLFCLPLVVGDDPFEFVDRFCEGSAQIEERGKVGHVGLVSFHENIRCAEDAKELGPVGSLMRHSLDPLNGINARSGVVRVRLRGKVGRVDRARFPQRSAAVGLRVGLRQFA